ncbi:TetR/AcrR family transcriptional regulator [Agromyces subbeticus]|uniref:TetR/AcrR family transcriptional regulator n=1 Tax=Agromyces subbeticus TaxID=293890 RepID=UPI0003B5AD82|nr:TetR/AcrR family transcriptional regulator [Agromyces subbeticus]
MAWDTERTKRLLLEAATAEFSEHGLAGARMDRIATSAGVNKERIYQYFGKKDELFATVLATQLRETMDAVPLSGTGPAAAGDYAGRLFDHHIIQSTIPRLLFWEGLERGAGAAADAARIEYHRVKAERFRELLPGIDLEQAAELLLTIVTLVNGWPVLGHLDTLLVVGATGAPGDRAAARRNVIVRSVEVLASAAQAEAAARA